MRKRVLKKIRAQSGIYLGNNALLLHARDSQTLQKHRRRSVNVCIRRVINQLKSDILSIGKKHQFVDRANVKFGTEMYQVSVDRET